MLFAEMEAVVFSLGGSATPVGHEENLLGRADLLAVVAELNG